ncbi:hypothetical protein FOA43_002291 [Brettanomyces nanus]|uniref:Uncharacterized protein n=1 Tax=Eeniella nana TaxID=13502 RepID=A0A875S4G1_EENNA|nr:uncharacterized protein FOA43_002291 [Brettanomyces nanus]QPG74952.1 hypothetical protein FOA43_002291 [Brettanomyces nanus]
MTRLLEPLTDRQFNDTITALSHLRMTELKAICRALQLTVAGRKAEVHDRIQRYITSGHHNADLPREHAIRELILKADQGEPLPDYYQILSSFRSMRSSSRGHKYKPAQRILGINFKPSPFFSLKRRVVMNGTNSILAIRQPEGRGTARITFSLLRKDVEVLHSSSTMRLFLLSGAVTESNDSEEKPLEFPQPIELTFNGTKLTDNVKGIKGVAGSAKPADLTPKLYEDKVNVLDIVYAYTKRDFLLSIYIVEITTVETLLSRVLAQPCIPREITISMIKENADQDDMVASKEIISLKCPCSYMKMQYPARSMYCEHFQCFDAYSFLKLQDQAPSWLCPICTHKIPLNQLLVDDYFSEVVKITDPSVEFVELEPDGSWRPKVVMEERRVHHKPITLPNANGIKVEDRTIPQQHEGDEIEVIDLDSEPEVPANGTTENNDVVTALKADSSSDIDTILPRIQKKTLRAMIPLAEPSPTTVHPPAISPSLGYCSSEIDRLASQALQNADSHETPATPAAQTVVFEAFQLHRKKQRSQPPARSVFTQSFYQGQDEPDDLPLHPLENQSAQQHMPVEYQSEQQQMRLLAGPGVISSGKRHAETADTRSSKLQKTAHVQQSTHGHPAVEDTSTQDEINSSLNMLLAAGREYHSLSSYDAKIHNRFLSTWSENNQDSLPMMARKSSALSVVEYLDAMLGASCELLMRMCDREVRLSELFGWMLKFLRDALFKKVQTSPLDTEEYADMKTQLDMMHLRSFALEATKRVNSTLNNQLLLIQQSIGHKKLKDLKKAFAGILMTTEKLINCKNSTELGAFDKLALLKAQKLLNRCNIQLKPPVNVSDKDLQCLNALNYDIETFDKSHFNFEEDDKKKKTLDQEFIGTATTSVASWQAQTENAPSALPCAQPVAAFTEKLPPWSYTQHLTAVAQKRNQTAPSVFTEKKGSLQAPHERGYRSTGSLPSLSGAREVNSQNTDMTEQRIRIQQNWSAEMKIRAEARRVEEVRKAEEARKAEEGRKVEEARKKARKVEETRQAEKARKVAEARRVEDARKVTEARKAEAQKAEEARRVAEARMVEEARMAEQARKVAQARKAEQARKVAEARKAEETRRVEDARMEDQARKVAEARKVEEARKAEEARKVAEARRVEEARMAEQARKVEEARMAEQARKVAEARKAEEARKVAEARKAEEARKVAEARRVEEARMEDQARKVAEARRVEEARMAEEARKMAEARKAEVRIAEARKAEEDRRTEQARKAEVQKAEEARKTEEARKVEKVCKAEETRRAEVQKAEEARKAGGGLHLDLHSTVQQRIADTKERVAEAKKQQEQLHNSCQNGIAAFKNPVPSHIEELGKLHKTQQMLRERMNASGMFSQVKVETQGSIPRPIAPAPKRVSGTMLPHGSQQSVQDLRASTEVSIPAAPAALTATTDPMTPTAPTAPAALNATTTSDDLPKGLLGFAVSLMKVKEMLSHRSFSGLRLKETGNTLESLPPLPPPSGPPPGRAKTDIQNHNTEPEVIDLTLDD